MRELHDWLPWVIVVMFVLLFGAYVATLVAKDPDSMGECEEMCIRGYSRGPKSFKAATATEPMFCECFPPKAE